MGHCIDYTKFLAWYSGIIIPRLTQLSKPTQYVLKEIPERIILFLNNSLSEQSFKIFIGFIKISINQDKINNI